MPDRPIWTTACPDWESRIVARQSLMPCAPLFPAEAEAGLAIFNQLRVVDVAGGPTIGQLARPFVTDFAASIFGAYDPETGRRMIREWFFLVSKKNWKSGIAAGVMLTALLLNWRQSGEYGILSPTIEAANNCFKPARDMIYADDELKDLLHVQEHVRTITHRQTKATLQVVAADSEAVAGKKWIGTLVDELWLFGKKLNADKMLLEATGGVASRPEGFVIYLSTHSDEPPAGVFDQKLKYARGVRDGRIEDPEFVPVLYEYPPRMLESKAYLDPETWHITNPNLGASVDPTFIRRKIREAEEGGEETLQAVLAKHLNVEIGLGLMSNRWAGADFWEQQADKRVTLDYLIERCEVIAAGIDFGGVDDWLGVAAMGREKETGDWLLWTHAWAHKIAFDRRKAEASRWHDFAADGDLTIVESVGDDVRGVVDVVMRLENSGLLERIGVDRWRIQEVHDAIVAEGIDPERMVAVDQGWRLVGAIGSVERKLAAKKMRHGGQRMMAYCVGNARVEPKGNAIAITKQAAGGSSKIDPLMATFNAGSLMALNPDPLTKKYQMLFV